MELGFETIGNAILICHDRKPVLVTDPWIKGDAYFGSWSLSHEIPDEQMQSIKSCEYIWISHGHPDHLNADSLRLLKDKKILLPDHVGGRIFKSLKEQNYNVHLIKDKIWQQISDRIRILCLCDYNQDATLLVDINGRLILNMNDGSALGWTGFIRNTIKKYQKSFYLRLYGFGNADMINVFEEGGTRILPDPVTFAGPLGPQIARETEFLGAKYFIPFSSFHIYQREDSFWAEEFSPALQDFEQGFDSESSEILPAFIKYNCITDQWEKINPRKLPIVMLSPEAFGDRWGEQLDRSDVVAARRYFQSISHVRNNLDFINLRVGGKDNILEIGNKNSHKGITFEAPRHSLMIAIENEIFDDVLIGNFAKTILHGEWPLTAPYKSPLYPDFTPYLAKYADNGRARSQEDLRVYFNEYRKRIGGRGVFDLIVGNLENRAKGIFRSYIDEHAPTYKIAKKLYHSVRTKI